MALLRCLKKPSTTQCSIASTPMAYLRITPQDDGFMLKVMYIEESNLTSPNRDVPLLDLMIDLKGGCMGDEIFIPNKEAIHTLAEGYRTMTSFTICQN